MYTHDGCVSVSRGAKHCCKAMIAIVLLCVESYLGACCKRVDNKAKQAAVAGHHPKGVCIKSAIKTACCHLWLLPRPAITGDRHKFAHHGRPHLSNQNEPIALPCSDHQHARLDYRSD